MTAADYDPKRKRAYRTGEIAALLDASRRTVERLIDAGEFGREGYDWWWTEAGPHVGHRRVSAHAVNRYIAPEG